MSNLTSASGEGSGSSGNRGDDFGGQGLQDPTSSCATAPMSDNSERHQTAVKRKRNLPGTPDPDAEVIALSPKTLMATNRFVCEICHKGFQRDQNLQLHRRGHNLPWKLRQRLGNEIRKRVYVCPELSCVHHEPARALGDLTGIKKHFSRKHGEKKWKCDKCSKRYAVQSDWKAHLKICGTREYRCDCGTFFSRRDSFITHRAFCDALAEENARVSTHKQGEGQQSGGPDGGVLGPSGGSVVPTGATSSSHKADSQLSEGPTDILASSDVSKVGMPDDMSNFALTQTGIPSLSSRPKGGTGQNSSSDAPVKGPKLSLWLGSGPGPGPPQIMGGPRTQPFAIPISRGMTDGGMCGVFGFEGYDATRPEKLARGMLPFSAGAGGMFANVFSSGSNCSGSQGASNGMTGNMPSFNGATDIGPALSGFPFSSAGMGGSISTCSFVSASAPPGISPNYKQQQHTASAQMSATALLQKAAQMGATASSSSFFRGFGLGTGESSSMAQRQASRQDQGRAGTNNILPSSTPTYASMRRPGDPSSNAQEISSFRSSLLRQERSNGSSGVQEYMNSLSGGAGLFGGASVGYLPSLLAASNSPIKQHKLEEKTQEFQSNLLPVRSHSQVGATQAGLGGLRIGEGGVDRPTLDFLGVGRPGGTAGSTTGIGRTLSLKDIASITSLGTTMVKEPFNYQNNNLQPVGPKPHSPGNSWGSP